MQFSLLFIFGLVLTVGGFFGIALIVFRKISVLAKLPEESLVSQTALKDKAKALARGLQYSTFRPVLFSWLEKVLRKTRVFVLRLDNIFLSLIAQARDKSQVWTIRSRAWIEHNRLKKREKISVLEGLDKVEVLENLNKNKQLHDKEEDLAFRQKLENMTSQEETSEQEAAAIVFSAEEKDCIDEIAKNPKSVDAYKRLGFLYLRHKNFPDARSCFRQVLKLSPEENEVKKKLEEVEGLVEIADEKKEMAA